MDVQRLLREHYAVSLWCGLLLSPVSVRALCRHPALDAVRCLTEAKRILAGRAMQNGLETLGLAIR